MTYVAQFTAVQQHVETSETLLACKPAGVTVDSCTPLEFALWPIFIYVAPARSQVRLADLVRRSVASARALREPADPPAHHHRAPEYSPRGLIEAKDGLTASCFRDSGCTAAWCGLPGRHPVAPRMDPTVLWMERGAHRRASRTGVMKSMTSDFCLAMPYLLKRRALKWRFDNFL